MNDDRLYANYSFVQGEYISNMEIKYGGAVGGFIMTTNVQMYTPILDVSSGSGGDSATGQRMLYMSGEVHSHLGAHYVSRLRVYFDTC